MDPKAIHETLVARFGEKITGAGLEAVSPFAVVAPLAIAEVAAFCKADPALAFDNLMCLSGVDYPKEAPPRMEVVYHLYSYTHLHTFALKVHLPRENPAVPAAQGLAGPRVLQRAAREADAADDGPRPRRRANRRGPLRLHARQRPRGEAVTGGFLVARQDRSSSE